MIENIWSIAIKWYQRVDSGFNILRVIVIFNCNLKKWERSLVELITEKCLLIGWMIQSPKRNSSIRVSKRFLIKENVVGRKNYQSQGCWTVNYISVSNDCFGHEWLHSRVAIIYQQSRNNFLVEARYSSVCAAFDVDIELISFNSTQRRFRNSSRNHDVIFESQEGNERNI